MNKTIYNTYVVMESQEQCDRMKQLCIDNGLPYWSDEVGFKMIDDENYFGYSAYEKHFAVWGSYYDDETQINEQEFIELLKTAK